eukprot:5736267-Alexandrium_andersonii.AAC.1
MGRQAPSSSSTCRLARLPGYGTGTRSSRFMTPRPTSCRLHGCFVPLTVPLSRSPFESMRDSNLLPERPCRRARLRGSSVTGSGCSWTSNG